MNYIKEINSFYDWLETNTVTDSAIVLWHALMHISNRAGWPDEFAVAISTLSVKTGLKKDAIIRARLRLQQLDRIDFNSRSGQQSAIYKIFPFESFKPTQPTTQNDSVVLSDTNRNANRAQTATQTEHKPRPLLNDIISAASTAPPAQVQENFYTAYQRVYRRTLTPFQMQELGAYIDDECFEEAVIIRAIERSAMKEGGLSLVLTMLNDYAAAGAKTLEGAVAADNQFEAGKQRRLANRSEASGTRQRTQTRLESANEKLLREIKEAERHDRTRGQEAVSGYPEHIRVIPTR